MNYGNVLKVSRNTQNSPVVVFKSLVTIHNLMNYGNKVSRNTQNSPVIVFKSLVTIHNLMNYGNEVSRKY